MKLLSTDMHHTQDKLDKNQTTKFLQKTRTLDLKIQKQISPTCLVLIAGNMNASVASQSKRREENCTGRYLRGLRSKNGEHLVNLRESNILET